MCFYLWIFLFNFFLVLFDLLLQGFSMLPLAHQLFDLTQIFALARVLLLLGHLHTRPAVACADMLDEICTIADQLAFNRVDEGTRAIVKAVGATYLAQPLQSAFFCLISIQRQQR